jgi:hypothetical protein
MGRALCDDALQEGACRVVTEIPKGVHVGHLASIGSEGARVGCIVGGAVGAAFAIASSAGLATAAGAIGGCFVVGSTVVIIEDLL